MILLHYSLRPRKLPWILTCYEFCRCFFPPFRKLQNFSGCINCHCVGYKEVHLWSYRLLVPWISSDDRRGGDFWDPKGKSSAKMPATFGSSLFLQWSSESSAVSSGCLCLLNQGMALGKSIRCTLLMKLCLCCRDQCHVEVFVGLQCLM